MSTGFRNEAPLLGRSLQGAGEGPQQDSQAPSLSSSSSTWSLRESILSPRPHSSATSSGRSSSGGMGSTARTQAPAWAAHCKSQKTSGRWHSMQARGPKGLVPASGSPAPAAPGALEALRPPASASGHSRLPPRLPELEQHRAAGKVAPARAPAGPGFPAPGPHSPATPRMPALVGRPGGPWAHVRPSGPSTWPRGQPQVKLPAVLRQRCEHRERPVLHSSTSGCRKEEGAKRWAQAPGLPGPPAGRSCALTHVAVPSAPTRRALAQVRPNADTSVQAGLGADGCSGLWEGVPTLAPRAAPQHPPHGRPPPQGPEDLTSPSQVSAPGCRFFQPWQHTAWVCCTSRLTSRHATRYVVL